MRALVSTSTRSSGGFIPPLTSARRYGSSLASSSQPGVSEYRIVAKLVVKAKTINAPGYKYGPFRVWGDVAASEYYRIFSDPTQDVFELLRILPLGFGQSGIVRPDISSAGCADDEGRETRCERTPACILRTVAH